MNDLLATSDLAVGTRLVSTNGAHPASAKVLGDGRIEFDGKPYDTPSAAASAAKAGASANGWDFWAVEAPSGRITLATLRARHLDARTSTSGDDNTVADAVGVLNQDPDDDHDLETRLV